jgi:Heavy-metal resistance
MIGFLVGTACLLGLIGVVRGGRSCGGRDGRYGQGYGGGSCGDSGGWGRGGRGRRGGRGGRGWGGPPWARGGEGQDGGGFGPTFLLRALFQRLDTTPGQEKVIKAAVEDLQTKARAAKDEAKTARGEIAKAMRSESFDEVLIGGATAHLESTVDTMRKAGIDAFAKVHEVLDEKQRAILADFIESGPRGLFGGRGRDHDRQDMPGDRHHPYRGYEA